MKNKNTFLSICGIAAVFAVSCNHAAEASRSNSIGKKQAITSPTVQWQITSQSVSESVGVVQVTAVLSGSSSTSISVPYSVGGTATVLGDYIGPSGSLSIPAGSTSASVSIQIVDDTVVESTETLILTMGTPVGATKGTNTVHTISILDNDVAPTPTPTLTTAPTATNLLTNPSFESGTTGWNIWENTTVVTGQAQSGSYAIQTGVGAGGFGQDILSKVVAGKSYRLTFYGKANSIAEMAAVNVKITDSSSVILFSKQTMIDSPTYKQYAIDFTMPSGAASASVFFWKSTASTYYAYLDNFSLTDAGTTVASPTPAPTLTVAPSPIPSPTATSTPVPTSAPVANAYYFSSLSGDDSRTSTEAKNPATPWRSIAKLNAVFPTLESGYAILFKRGETFSGTINIGKSGTATTPLVIGAYGTGAKPIITGFTTLTSWTSEGNGIYSATLSPQSAPNIVIVNGVNTRMGRYPNTGYLTYESHSGNTSITDSQLTSTPNWTGAEAIIRKNRWMLDRNVITNHSGTTLTYTAGSTWNPTDGFGYFIQNALSTLDAADEWYYNAGKFYMYFGSTSPSTKVVKVGVIDKLADLSLKDYVTFDNLTFEGANKDALQITTGKYITVQNCEFIHTGRDGILVDHQLSTNAILTVENNVFNHNNVNAIAVRGPSNYARVRNNTISNTGMIPGAGNNEDSSGDAIVLYGTNSVAEFNTINNAGHSGISLRLGDAITARNNFINSFGMTKYDAGGIYSWNNAVVTTSRTIANNIILNSNHVNEGAGTSPELALFGVYLDEYSSHTLVTGNTIANVHDAGIVNLNSADSTISNNVCYNNGTQLTFTHAFGYGDAVKGMVVQNNIFFSKLASQPTFYFRDDSNPFSAFGTADGNRYLRPIDDNLTITTEVSYSQTKRTLAGWQSLSGQDIHSYKSPVSITSTDAILFEYNATTVSKTIPLVGSYTNVQGATVSGSVTLAPFTSILLIKQ